MNKEDNNIHIMITSNLEQYKKNVFLCHRKEDEGFIKNLAEKLKENKVNIWVDYEDLIPGVNWWNKIEQEIADTDAIIIIVSKATYKGRSVYHEEIDLALKINQELPPEKQMLILPILIDLDAEIYTLLKSYHHIRVEKFYTGDWFEKLLESLGIIKNRELEFSFARQKIIVDIEKLKIELIECWIRKEQYKSIPKRFEEEEQQAINISKYIDEKCEQINERFRPALLYRKLKFEALINNAAPLPSLKEIIFYPPHAILVDKKYIRQRIYLVEKGGEPKEASVSKKIGQFEHNSVICGFAHFYSYQSKCSPIEMGKEYNVYDDRVNEFAILIGSFKAE